MSKFKVGDEVLIKDSENNTLLEEVFVEDKILFEITSVYYNDTKKMWAYKIRDLKNTFGFNYAEDELELYKTPHQELLDLGWKEIKHYETHIRYQLNFQFELLIERKGKGYEILEYTEVKHIVDLKLSRILTRYLEELE